MAEKFSQKEFLAELKALGVEKVRSHVETGHYGKVSQKGPIAKEWLRQQDQFKANRVERVRDSSNREHLRVAKSAKNAAWAAAIAAIIAAACAIVAIVISLHLS